MALEGTLRDFGLADIFQLIGIQRKTGMLALERDRETVVVKFLDGRVVGADNLNFKLEDLLGSVLVRTGRITQSQLDEALRVQRKTLQRLGYVLVQQRFIGEDDLSEALRTQVTQIIYRLFRWRHGNYKFDPTDHVDYDQAFVPINAETILMEGARMVDEWPIIERRIRSEDMILRRTAAAERLEAPVESIVDADVAIDLVMHSEGSSARAGEDEIRLSAEERDILRLVDGRSTVRDLADRSAQGEFDVYRILSELVTRNLVEEVTVARPTARVGRGAWAERVAGSAAIVVLLAACAVSAATLSANPFTPWRLAAQSGETDRLRTFASRGRLERIERAIQLFFLDTGSLPADLALLVRNGYLDPADLLDPWGRPYVYKLDPGSYTLTGMDSRGRIDRDLTVNRRFSATERMILDAVPVGQL